MQLNCYVTGPLPAFLRFLQQNLYSNATTIRQTTTAMIIPMIAPTPKPIIEVITNYVTIINIQTENLSI